MNSCEIRVRASDLPELSAVNHLTGVSDEGPNERAVIRLKWDWVRNGGAGGQEGSVGQLFLAGSSRKAGPARSSLGSLGVPQFRGERGLSWPHG